MKGEIIRALPEIIRTIKDSLGEKIIIPKSLTRAVRHFGTYHNDERLDHVIDSMNDDLMNLKLYLGTKIYQNTTTIYTATENCYICVSPNPSSPVYINDVVVSQHNTPYYGFLKKGQTVAFETASFMRAFSLIN